MKLATKTAAALFCLLAGGSTAPAIVAAQQSDAYLDQTARTLVNGARARRQTVDRSILEYTAISSERMSAGYRIIGRDRLMFRRETASKIHWARTGPIEIEVLGAREVVPVAMPKVQVPGDLKRFMPHIAFDPMDSEFLLKMDTTDILHPFSSVGEANYKFRSGDSTTITLQDGRKIRLRELEFIPRRRDPNLIAGSFWLDADSYAVVQAVFKLARPFDSTLDSEPDDKPPGWLPTMTGDISYVAVDYGLYELRWWLPRYMAMEGVFRFGNMASMPMKYERTYSDYEVIGDTSAVRVAIDSTTRACRPMTEISVSVNIGDQPDSAEIQERRARNAGKRAERDSVLAKAKARRDSINVADSVKNNRPPCTPREYRITQRPDSILLKSEYLPPSIYAGETLLSQNEIKEITDRIEHMPQVPWLLGMPRLAVGFGGPGLVRYNRIEGLSVGARSTLDFGRMSALGELRFGVADKQVSAELAFLREAATRSYRIGGYRRLNTTDATLRPFSLSSSVGALLLGADEAKYFRSAGAEIIVAPASARSQWYNLRMYAEHQGIAKKNTDFNLRHLLNKSFEFTENIDVDRANQYGGELTLRRDFGLNPGSVRAGLELTARGETGTFEFARPSLKLRVTSPLPFHLAFGGEAAIGSSVGTVPTQSMWYIGGTNTLRGYRVGVLSGDAFWRGRAEVATNLPLFRLALFSDAGWAGFRDDITTGKPLLSAGVGVSMLDGIVRVDLARALRSAGNDPKGWRLHMYMGGVF